MTARRERDETGANSRCGRPTTEGDREGPPMGRTCASRSVILLAVTVLPCAAAAQGDGQPFRVGFSSTMFTDVNESDAKAAIKVWAQTVARERGIETDPDPCILTGLTELASALRNKQVDMVALLTEEYRALSPAVRLTSFFVGYVGGRPEEEICLAGASRQRHRERGGLEGAQPDHLPQSRRHRSPLVGWIRSCWRKDSGRPPSFWGSCLRTPSSRAWCCPSSSGRAMHAW